MPTSRDSLTPAVHAFLELPHVVTISTVNDDGSPHQAVAWFRLEPDGRLLVNSRTPRRWPANLRRDPRVSLAVIDPADPDRWVGITASVDEIVDDVARARDDIVALAHRYRDGGPTASAEAMFRSQPRVTFLLRVERVHDHLDD